MFTCSLDSEAEGGGENRLPSERRRFVKLFSVYRFERDESCSNEYRRLLNRHSSFDYFLSERRRMAAGGRDVERTGHAAFGQLPLREDRRVWNRGTCHLDLPPRNKTFKTFTSFISSFAALKYNEIK